jgi:hypothetical protein
LEELRAIGKARGRDEPHIVGRERIGDDELGAGLVDAPVGQIIVIGVRDIGKAAFARDEIDGVDRTAAGVPPQRPGAGGNGVKVDGRGDSGGFLVGRHILVLDPF